MADVLGRTTERAYSPFWAYKFPWDAIRSLTKIKDQRADNFRLKGMKWDGITIAGCTSIALTALILIIVLVT
ncbi:hypothetical protein [Bradyrhizobium elkanii]|uniref:hypothetical protein n=1 Tax=Bradyrhizobium elkanii TaxID=29448 RepID=UPI0012FE25ED|nr:hypothetical protein [Bradyrhizobium elkanii]